MEKILDIIELIAYEKGLDHHAVLEIVKNGLIKIAQDEINPHYQYFVEQDTKERTLKLFYRMRVCEDSEVFEDEAAEAAHIRLSQAKELGDVSVGDEVDCELSLDCMSRGAINKLFLNLEFNLQRAIENQILDNFRAQMGKIVSGQVVGIDDGGNTFVEIESIRATLPQKNRIKGEKFKVGDTIRAILKFVNINKNGLYVELSRTTPKFLEELLALEVPEIKDGEVVIHKSARIPGERAKVAVYSNNPRIDAIGCCVGVKGVRINAVSRELNGENIDCVEHHSTPEIFIAKALTPAHVLSIKLEKPKIEESAEGMTEGMTGEAVRKALDSESSESSPETELALRKYGEKESEKKPRAQAIVQIKSDQKSKAIGKSGVNIRLASMLCECDIELQEVGGALEIGGLEHTNEADSEAPKRGLDALSSLFKS